VEAERAEDVGGESMKPPEIEWLAMASLATTRFLISKSADFYKGGIEGIASYDETREATASRVDALSEVCCKLDGAGWTDEDGRYGSVVGLKLAWRGCLRRAEYRQCCKYTASTLV